MTDPEYEANPANSTSLEWRWRINCPMLTMPPRTMSVARASPTWVLCAYTAPLDSMPWWSTKRSMVSLMW
ncbi:hypothetical protein GCM10009628_11020 [Paeniglutamicibacter kerguelensis]|uniref:Uncharacterized protein n=1 Tax=Paeniglutamicibacter kerguelensis TaxID=254788 RepID=A0ABS4XCT9_9MICC|nr:hypothetical protein [Paeniglutamicibacter kerguelensis]